MYIGFVIDGISSLMSGVCFVLSWCVSVFGWYCSVFIVVFMCLSVFGFIWLVCLLSMFEIVLIEMVV